MRLLVYAVIALQYVTPKHFIVTRKFNLNLKCVNECVNFSPSQKVREQMEESDDDNATRPSQSLLSRKRQVVVENEIAGKDVTCSKLRCNLAV